MSYRQALALATLLDEVNTRAPRRSTASDGWIGDAAHRSRTSDHNPWVDDGVVTARDFTDDPSGGHNATEFAEFLRTSRDPRIKYVIDQGRMFSSYDSSGGPAWAWRNYSGSNQHIQHTHVSVQPYKNLYDSVTPWGWADARTDNDLEATMFCKQGDKGSPAVNYWQRVLRQLGQNVTVDGDYGAGTAKAVAAVTGSNGEQIGSYQMLVLNLRLYGRGGKSLTLADIAKALTD